MPETHVIATPSALHGRVRAFIARDTTRHAAPQLPALNRFPATQFCTITWFVDGQTHDGDSLASPLLDRIVVSGPLSRPRVTCNPGPVHAFMVILYPDALQQWTGADLAALTDRLLPARDVLDAGAMAFAEAILVAGCDGERLTIAQAWLRQQWAPAALAPPEGMPWLRSLSARLNNVQRAIGERQFERKVKQLTGQSMQALRRNGRLESALLQARQAADEGALDWPRLAVEAGYADQPHLCREVRRLSGVAPGELLRRSGNDDSYWLYRWWR